jgi:hypothetical protein
MNGMNDIKFFALDNLSYNINVDKSNNFNVLFLNINRLINKIPRLEFLLGSLDVEFDAIVLCETWLQYEQLDTVNLEGFVSFHKLRLNSNGPGGLTIFLRNCYIANVIDHCVITASHADGHEFLVIDIQPLDIKLCATCRQPSSRIDVYLERLDNLLGNFRRMIVAGDTNINLYTKNTNSLSFINILQSNGFYLFNSLSSQMYTRKSNTNTISIIDHIFSDLDNFKNPIICVGDNDVSDHRFIITSLQFPKNIFSELCPSSSSFSKVSFHVVSQLLTSLNSSNFNEFYGELCNLIKNNTKKITVPYTFTNRKPWFGLELRELMKIRNKFYKLKKKYPLNNFYNHQFKYYRNILNLKINKSKQGYYEDLVKNFSNKPAKLWNIIYEVINNQKRHYNSQIPDIHFQSKVITDSLEKSNAFNSFFTSVGANIPNNSILHNSRHVTPVNLLSDFEPTTPEEINAIIMSLKSGAAAGYDSIKPKFLKDNITFFANILSQLINNSFVTGQFPDELKIAKVIPIYKTGQKENVTNYRPISILPCLSKVYELAIRNRLEAYLFKNNLINPNQFGFLKRSSTISATSSLIDEIVKSINNKLKTSALFLDLRKAFDCMNFEVLDGVLQDLGITGPQFTCELS